MNFRDLAVAPQTAIYNVVQAVKTLNLSTIVNAIATGVVDVAKAGVQFVTKSVGDIVNAIVGALPGGAQASAAATKAAAVKAAGTATTSLVAGTEPGTEPVKQPVKDTPDSTESGNGATDLSDGNKVEPGKSGSARTYHVGAVGVGQGRRQLGVDR